ncbi:hypothetical protein GL284_16410 [Paracoccus sp. DK608]|uniref:Uncharacterized protein n=1 Tax=Paracoccus shanxieyensis TaxID=2675752 RepID=A0A6L6IZC1_9RHOB|nr:hypothetical protein [Paracoccus shanxieyensis]MTH89235.1 hypothetical protein [Paracoccus shanxieyensis]
MTASVTNGRALRYAEGSARGLLHHVLGHCPYPYLTTQINADPEALADYDAWVVRNVA